MIHLLLMAHTSNEAKFLSHRSFCASSAADWLLWGFFAPSRPALTMQVCEIRKVLLLRILLCSCVQLPGLAGQWARVVPKCACLGCLCLAGRSQLHTSLSRAPVMLRDKSRESCASEGAVLHSEDGEPVADAQWVHLTVCNLICFASSASCLA